MPHDPPVADADLLLDAIHSMEEALVAYDTGGRLLMCDAAFQQALYQAKQQCRNRVVVSPATP